MTIETKFNIGDEVWFKHFGFIKSAVIYYISISIFNSGDIHNTYYLTSEGCFFEKIESELFRTEKGLLDNL